MKNNVENKRIGDNEEECRLSNVCEEEGNERMSDNEEQCGPSNVCEEEGNESRGDNEDILVDVVPPEVNEDVDHETQHVAAMKDLSEHTIEDTDYKPQSDSGTCETEFKESYNEIAKDDDALKMKVLIDDSINTESRASSFA